MKNTALFRFQEVFKQELNTIIESQKNLDDKIIASIIKLLTHHKKHIIATGCGTSGAAAKKIVHSLNCIEKSSSFLYPGDALHGGLGILQSGDILLLISKGGNTKELCRIVDAAKQKNVTIISVSENENSYLMQQADYPLKIKIKKEPCPFNMLATASTLAVIAVFDAIIITLMQTTKYNKNQFAIIHPDGDVGKRLLK